MNKLKLSSLTEARKKSNVCRAIANNDVTALKKALDCNSNGDGEVNVQLCTGETPLLLAILNKNEQAVRLLLQHGADVNMEGAYYDLEPDINDTCVCRRLLPSVAAVESCNVDIAETVLERARGCYVCYWLQVGETVHTGYQATCCTTG
jgi:hypothetical protein